LSSFAPSSCPVSSNLDVVVLKPALSGCVLIDEMTLDLKGLQKAGLTVARVEKVAMREVLRGMARENARSENIVARGCRRKGPKI
jgi:hypothetical protein